MAGIRWSQDEDEILRNSYPLGVIGEIADTLNRTQEAIKIRAKRLGVKRDNATYRNGTTCVNLLSENYEAAYWTGFILADGHVSNSRLVVTVAERDGTHLEKLARFLNCNTHKGCSKYRDTFFNNVRIAVQDIDVMPVFVERYSIDQRKTYNPPSIERLNNLPDSHLFALMVGFIDGDGTIVRLKNRPTVNIVIKCHKSWFDVLEFFREKIVEFSSINSNMKTRLVDEGRYAELRISSQPLISFIIQEWSKFRLPVLERKWETATHIK